MTTPSNALPLAGVSGHASASRAGSLRALGQFGRVALLAGVILIMVLLRSQSNLAIGLALTAVAAGGLWLAIGREGGVRPLVIYVIGFGLFAQLRAFADQSGVPVRFDYVVDLEASLFGRLPSVWLQDHLYRPGGVSPIDAFSAGVYISYFVAPHIVALVIWQRARDRFALYAGAVLLTLYAGLIVCALVPTAPPWLAGQEGHAEPVARVFRVVSASLVPGAYNGGASVAGVNEVAAMPSLHTAITVVIALFAWRANRRLGALGGAYAVAMGFTLVYFGEHYFVDVIAGAATAVVCWQVALRLWSPLRLNSQVGARANGNISIEIEQAA